MRRLILALAILAALTPELTAQRNVTPPTARERQSRDSRELQAPTRGTAAPVSENKSAVAPTLLTFGDGEGSLEGRDSFAASPHTGAGGYAIGFALPPGRAGHTPSLGLRYSTQAGQGVAGLGWSIPESIIQRDPTTRPRYPELETDGSVFPVPSADRRPLEDRFVLDGEELVPVDASIADVDCLGYGGGCAARPSDVSGWQEYRPRAGGMARVFRAPDYQRWVVQRTDGSRVDYGLLMSGPAAAVSASEEALVRDGDRIHSWHATRRTDAAGSPIYSIYERVEGQPILQSLYYLSPAACAPESGDALDVAHAVRTCSSPLSSYGARVAFVYEARPDPSVSFRTGFAVERTQRLVRVDISASHGEERAIVRRYHLEYHAGTRSMLASVQQEGRPETADGEYAFLRGQHVPEDTPAGSGPRLPAMRFEYTPGIGATGFDWTVHAIGTAPSVSLANGDVDLFDVDRDGLPDVVRAPGGDPEVFFNGFQGFAAAPAGGAARFSAAIEMPSASGLSLSDSRIRPMDSDGDGISEYLRVTPASNSRFRPQRTNSLTTVRRGEQGLEWERTDVVVEDSTMPDLDSLDGPTTRYVDVDADGYVDIVRHNGSVLFVWWNLAPYGRPGEFGSTVPSPSGWAVVDEPQEPTCAPDTAFDEPETKVADLNGDGYVDLLRIQSDDLYAYYGRGDGHFGDEGCAPDATFPNALAGFTFGDWEELRVVDLDGDGLRDLVQLGNTVRVRLGEGGDFAPVEVTVALGSGDGTDVRLADIDGNGSVDIVRGEVGDWRYLSPGGIAGEDLQPPRLLTEIHNGFGAVTSITYSTATTEYLRDLADADACGPSCDHEVFRWEERPTMACEGGAACPAGLGSAAFNVVVVKAVETRDGFLIGRDEHGEVDEGISRVEYDYHDAAYDGLGRSLLGFAVTDVREVGDATHPDGFTRTHFHQARRPEGLESAFDANPYAPMQGLPYMSESWMIDEGAPRYLSTEHTTYALRTLLFGLDGRPVQQAFAVQTDRLLYGDDPSAGGEVVTVPGIVAEGPGAAVGGTGTDAWSDEYYGDSFEYSLVARSDDFAHVRSRVLRRTNLGAVEHSVADGRLRDEEDAAPQAYDEAIETHAEHAVLNGGGQLVHAETARWISGGSEQLQHVTRELDALGRPLLETQHATAPTSFDFGALGATPTSSTRRTAFAYDAFGNVIGTCSGAATADAAECLDRRTFEYDPVFADLPRSESVYTGEGWLTTTATSDRGLGALASIVDPAGVTQKRTYDGLGRISAVHDTAGESCKGAPSSARYYLIHETYQEVRTWHLESCETLSYSESRVYQDALGRTRATLEQDVATNAWVRDGITLFDARGAARRTYRSARLEAGETIDPRAAVMPPDVGFVSLEYDGFGRVVRSEDELGNPTVTRYGPLRTESWNAEDLGGGPLSATPAVVRRDGHGRAVQSVEHNRLPDGTGEVFVHYVTEFRSDGSAVAVHRVASTSGGRLAPGSVVPPGATGESTSRVMVRDSLGRTLAVSDASVDAPDGGTWRYLHGESHLLAVRDPRGCGQDFAYDRAGRLIGERLVDCDESIATAPADVPLPDDAIGASGYVHVRRYFDAAPEWTSTLDGFEPTGVTYSGRLAAVVDTAQRSAMTYDARGRLVGTATQLARVSPGVALPPLAAPEDAGPPVGESAVVYDTTRTYVAAQEFDAADRLTARTLPREPDWDALGGSGAAPLVRGVAEFDTRRGLLRRSAVSIDGVEHDVLRSVEYAPHGAPTQMHLGDEDADIRTYNGFDPMDRLSSTVTLRRQTAAPGPDRPLGAVYAVHALGLYYDEVGRLRGVEDMRDPHEWEHLPRRVQPSYDALGRVVGVEYAYADDYMGDFQVLEDEADDWRDDYAAQAAVDPMRPSPAPMVSAPVAHRPISMSYEFDWLGNLRSSDDDAHSFYERSLGEVAHGSEVGGRPSAPYLASNLDASVGGDHGGWLSLEYGESGNVVGMTVHARCSNAGAATCEDPGGSDLSSRRATLESSCSCAVEQHYAYYHDAVNRIVEARRYDRDGGLWLIAARQRYAYDHGNQRRVKVSESFQAGVGTERAALYVIPGQYERRGVQWNGEGWAASSALGSESQYLVSGARVVWSPADAVSGIDPNHRITFAIRGPLGSTAAVIDLESNELLSYETRYPNGTRETLTVSDTPVPGEPNGFTGKESEDEVGLTYFGHRYLLSHLGHWATPDPAEIHAAAGGELGNHYHYVGGRILDHVDPLGLAGESISDRVDAMSRARGNSEYERRFNARRLFADPTAEQHRFIHINGASRLRMNGRDANLTEWSERASDFLDNEPGVGPEMHVVPGVWSRAELADNLGWFRVSTVQEMVESLDAYSADNSRSLNVRLWGDHLRISFFISVPESDTGVDPVAHAHSKNVADTEEHSLNIAGSTDNASGGARETNRASESASGSASGTTRHYTGEVHMVVRGEIFGVPIDTGTVLGSSEVAHWTEGERPEQSD